MKNEKIGASITSLVYSGRYMDDLILETDHWTISEEKALECKEKAKNHEPVDWNYVPEAYNHIVFYSEEKDNKGYIKHIDVFVDGAGGACDDEYYTKHFTSPARYTIAEHRKPLKKYKVKAALEFEGEIISSTKDKAIESAFNQLAFYDKDNKKIKRIFSAELLEK